MAVIAFLALYGFFILAVIVGTKLMDCIARAKWDNYQEDQRKYNRANRVYNDWERTEDRIRNERY